MAIGKLPPSIIDYARYERWVHASHALDAMLPALVPVVQGIGRIDAELCAEDAAYLARRDALVGNAAKVQFIVNEGAGLTDRLNLSALWLFGAYEAVRTLDYAIRHKRVAATPPIAARVNAVKLNFNRPRSLLAKHEPADRHKKTDSAPAQRHFHRGSLAWKVAPRTIVSRRALADSFLKLLERIAAEGKRARAKAQNR